MATGGAIMMRALAEVGAIVHKAALGAGIPVGQADDLARTAVHMAGRRDGLGPVVDALVEPDQAVDVAWGGDRLAIKAGRVAMTGPIVKDGFATGIVKARLANAAHIPLVAAMLGEAGVNVQVDGSVIRRVGYRAPDPVVGPVDIPDEIWNALATFAAKSYVPASDASRAGGAGAGLTDND